METRRITRMGMLTALSLILSYLEMLLPSFIPIPGIKLGLANIALVFALYTLPFSDTLFISLLRVFISSLLFGNVLSLLYSLSGALISLLVMALLKGIRINTVAVSTVGGVLHNTAQLGVAMLIVKSTALIYYLPFLVLSGAVTGFLIGTVTSSLLKRMDEERERGALTSY